MAKTERLTAMISSTARALAYTAGMPESEVRKMDSPAREEALLHQLDTQPFLFVLDGLERILLAYSRTDAVHLPDDDLDEKTANVVLGSTGDSPVPLGDSPGGMGESVVVGGGATEFRSRPAIPVGGSPTGTGESPVLPAGVGEIYIEKHRLRQCADPRAGRFLRRLAQVRASRVLVSTRLGSQGSLEGSVGIRVFEVREPLPADRALRYSLGRKHGPHHRVIVGERPSRPFPQLRPR